MYEENGIVFDIAPRDPSWKPYQGALPPRLKMRLGRKIDEKREALGPDSSYGDGWELAELEGIAAGREPFWTGAAGAHETNEHR